MDYEKELLNSAKNIVSELADLYDLRNVINDDAKYCEIIYNLTNNFVKTALLNINYIQAVLLLNGKILPPDFSMSAESDHYKLCLCVTETTAKIAEYNIKQLKENYRG